MVWRESAWASERSCWPERQSPVSRSGQERGEERAASSYSRGLMTRMASLTWRGRAVRWLRFERYQSRRLGMSGRESFCL